MSKAFESLNASSDIPSTFICSDLAFWISQEMELRRMISFVSSVILNFIHLPASISILLDISYDMDDWNIVSRPHSVNCPSCISSKSRGNLLIFWVISDFIADDLIDRRPGRANAIHSLIRAFFLSLDDVSFSKIDNG